MSLFTKKAEGVVGEHRDRDPSYIIGLLVNTRDVVLESLKNPWFLSTRQMAPIYGEKTTLISDANKSGFSVISPDYTRPESRKPWTYVGTLIPGIQGSDTGKLEGVSTEGLQSTTSVHNYLHMVVNRKETPTGVKLEQRRVSGVLDTNTQFSNQELEQNTPILNSTQTDKSLSQAQSVSSNQIVTETTNGVTKTKTITKKPLTVLPLNKALVDITHTGELVPTKASSLGSMRSRIQTGSELITNSAVGALSGMMLGVK